MKPFDETYFDKRYDEMKAGLGGSAAHGWIWSGVAVIIFDPNVKFLSCFNVLYFSVGIFLAAIIFGNLNYLAIRLIGKSKAIRNMHDGDVKGIGCWLMIATIILEAVCAWYVLRWLN